MSPTPTTRATAPAQPSEELPLEDDTPAPAPFWPEAPQPIASDLARTETREACAARIRASLVTEVAESIAGLGYERFIEDICGGLAAVRTGDVSGCDALSVSSARGSCRRRLALVHGQPEACPADPAVTGREPVCLAWAARDVGLCRGAALGERARCEAVLAGDARRCRALPTAERPRCTAEIARYGAALGSTRVSSAARLLTAELALEVTITAQRDRAEATSDASAPTADTFAVSKPALDRGVVIARCADGMRVRIGDARRSGAPFHLDGPADAELLLRWPADAPPGPLRVSAETHDAVLRLRIPHENDASSDPDGRGAVTLEAHDATRGSLIAGTIELRWSTPGGRTQVSGSFRTFVRDLLDPDAEECAH